MLASRCSRSRYVRVAVFAIVLAAPFQNSVQAQQVPSHLARLAATLVGATLADLEDDSGDEGRAWAKQKALAALDELGIKRWAAGTITLSGLPALADAIGLDLTKSEHDELLERLLLANSEEALGAVLADILKERGIEPSTIALEEARQGYWLAIAEMQGGLATRHVVGLPDKRDTLTFEWLPSSHQFRVRHKDDGDEWNEPVSTTLNGNLKTKVDLEDGTISLAAEPAENPVSAYSPSDLRLLNTAIFGDWIDQGGATWLIESPLVDEDERPAPEFSAGQTRAEQIREKQRQLDELVSSKDYVWENPETGETERQQRFRRLQEPWEYRGEQYSNDNAEARIEALEGEIKRLSQVDSVPPVEQHDPIGLEDAPAHAVTVTVRESSGYSFTYDEARFEENRVVARRTLRDERDISNLPQDVISQLIANWSPPEWVELEVDLDPASSSLVVTGLQWRLHVTYTLDFGAQVDSIHTPYSKPLKLTREGRRGP